MRSPLRTTLATLAVCALVGTGALVAPAHATDPEPAPACSAESAALESARADLVAARTAFTDYRGGRMVAAERAATRAELREAREAVRALRGELAHAEDREAARELRVAIRAAQAQAREAARVLRSPQALVAEARAERRTLKAAFEAAKDVAREARAALQECESGGGEPEPAPEEPLEG